MAIQCRTRQHADAKALAVVAIILYPVGLLLLTAALLFASRAAIRTKRPTTLSCAIAFLHREYEPQFFWWELVEMLRRLVLVGLMVLVQGSMMQIVVGTLLSAAFLLFQVQASPYLELSDDFLASVCSFFLVVVVVCSYAFKDFEFVGLPDIVEKMSREQKGVYVIDQGALIGVIILSVVGAIVISAGIFVVQFVVVGARLQREELARKARRLRMKSNDEEVLVEPIGEGHFHIFLSHVWGTGQDQMRIVKQRLLELVPALAVFLDVDDLKEGRGAEYVDRSNVVLVLVSNGYFHSPNCMRELLRADYDSKPIVSLLEREAKHGGLTPEEVRAQLVNADGRYVEWGLQQDMDEWGFKRPEPEHLYRALFESEGATQIEWNRIGAFQDVTMRLIAEALLPEKLRGGTYVQGELVQHIPDLRPPNKIVLQEHLTLLPRSSKSTVATDDPAAVSATADAADAAEAAPTQAEASRSQSHSASKRVANALFGFLSSASSGKIGTPFSRSARTPTNSREGGRIYHVYCSPHNEGALQLMREVSNALDIDVLRTTRRADLPRCAHMLVYLNAQTFTSGAASAAFAREVARAMELEVHLLLAHEMAGGAGQEARHGCDFGLFFANDVGATPLDLLKKGIYNEIAVPLKEGAWREASMAMLLNALSGTTEAAPADQSAISDITNSIEHMLARNVGRVFSASKTKVLAVSGERLSRISVRMGRMSKGGDAMPPLQAPAASTTEEAAASSSSVERHVEFELREVSSMPKPPNAEAV